MRNFLSHRLLGFMLALLLYLFLPSVTSAASDPPGRPNILFIFIDDMNMAPTSFGGQAITPNMDRLAQEGMRFLNAQVAAPACNPSRIALITGLRPASTGITSLSPNHVNWRHYLAQPGNPGYENYGPGIENIQTIFQHLRNHGYYVASTGKTFHSNEQLDQEPWDTMYHWPFWPGIGWPKNLPLNGLDDFFQATASDWGAIESAEDPHYPGAHYSEATLPDHNTQAHAQDILTHLPQDRPFFVSVGYVLPHLPWYVPQSNLNQYPLDALQLPPTRSDDLDDLPPNAVWLVNQGGNFYDQRYIFDDETQWRKAVAHYLAGISYVDQQIGQLLQILEDQGHLNDTIIILWSDHGFHLGEKAHLRKHTLWDVATRSPLIIKAPGLTQPGSSTDAVVNGIDLFPTIVDLAGLDMPTDFHRDGRSLMPLLKDPQAYWPWPSITTLGHWGQPTAEQSALRTRDWHYIRYNLFDNGPDRREELYHLAQDPHEWTNLLSPQNGDPAAYEPIRQQMEAILRGQVLPDQPPTAQSIQVQGFTGLRVPITLRGQDPNLDYLIFRIDTLPSGGQLYTWAPGHNMGHPITQPGPLLPQTPGWSAQLWYIPDPGQTDDTFTYSVSDGRTWSTAQVSIHITSAQLQSYYMPAVWK